MKAAAFALVLLALPAALSQAAAQEWVTVARAAEAAAFPARRGPCWRTPQAQTLEEAVIVAQNEANRAARPKPSGPPAMLALSDGRLKAAYGAGLVLGWGETGRRPEFAVVTAVGMSALFAPFAFLGSDGDGPIADIFACEAGSLQDMARRAGAYLTADVVARIAQRHRSGARLIVALTGSAARPETVWDIGAIAVSRHRGARELIAAILLASVDLTTIVDPETTPVKAGLTAKRNPALRRLGAGEPFLSTPSLKAPRTTTYLIHNGVLFADEGAQYAAAQALEARTARTDVWLLPAHDLFTAGQLWHAPTLIASPRAHMNIQPQRSAYDQTYMRALFLDAFRRGRMSREWRPTMLDPRSQY